MFKKKKFTLVEKKNKMSHVRASIKNIKWRNCVVTICLTSFALLLIFGNFKSKSYYVDLKATKNEMLQNESQSRSIQAFELLDEKSINCTIDNYCVVTCSGQIKYLKNYLANHESCSIIVLRVSNGIFPDDKLQSNWLEGSFYPTSIKVSLSQLSGIQDGAFDQQTLVYLSELELNDVQLSNLTEKSFVGFNSIETFTLVNRIEHFSGLSFLKPMMKTLKKLVIRHETSIATDPGPWLRGENFPKLSTIVFDGSNFGGYINAATFRHLKKLSTLMMNSCRITSIADGSFDFMKIQMILVISLQNNLLKRLDGDYLSTITSLRRLDIQNNPWDCTCELEHLARLIKENQEGFGENLKCSSPPPLAGKFLRETDLQKCEEKPSTTTTTTTTTTKTTSTKLSSISTSANFTDALVTTSIKHEYTTPSSHNRTTTLSADSIFVECGRQKVRFTNNFPPNVLELAPPDGHFEIVSISKTSVKMSFEGPSDNLAVIWFYEQPSTEGNVRIVGEFNIGCQSELDTTLVVNGLVENQSYIFCLIKNGSKVISPFNCQSHFSNVDGTINLNGAIWLMKKDKTLFICVFVASIVVAILVGLIGMCLLIRYHPHVLKCGKTIEVGSKKFEENQRNIKKSVSETSFENSFLSDATTSQLRRFSTESGLSYMIANNYEELEYYRRINVNNDLIFSNRVPRSPAPPLPKRSSTNLNQKAESIYKGNISVMEHRVTDDGYTCVV